MDAAVSLEEVTKRFDQRAAVNGISLSIPEGTIYGVIGPNGSGKTTTLRMILNIIRPDSGVIHIFGQRSHPNLNKAIGYLPEERGIYRKLKVGAQLIYFGKLKGLSGQKAKAAAREWLEKFGLGQWWNYKTEKLSKGMTQKIQLIATLIARPRLLILDEPFSGLDPVNLEIVRNAILDLRKSGSTILLSTHDMAVAENMCNRICMIHDGNKVLDGSLTEIRSQHPTGKIRLRFPTGNNLDLGRLPEIISAEQIANEWELDTSADPMMLLRAALDQSPIEKFEITQPSLHDIFVAKARHLAVDKPDLISNGSSE